MEEAVLELPAKSDYELCCLYADYHEWLNSPSMGPKRKATREKYEAYLKDILNEIGKRHGYEPEAAERAMLADMIGMDAKPHLEEMGAEQLRGCQETFKSLVRYCDEVLKEKGEK